MSKILRGVFLVGLIVCTTMVYAGGRGDAGQANLRLGSSSPDGAVEILAAREFARLLEYHSGGAMRADVLPGGLAGGERELVEGQQLGTVDMSLVGAVLQNFDPAMMILQYDFLFVNEDHVRYVFEGAIGQRIFNRLIDTTDVRVLAVFMRTPRIMSTIRPINTIDDLRGLRLRLPEMPARTALWTALGASPTPMAMPEVYTALQTRTIDGQENPITNIINARFYEVCDYLALSNHVYDFQFITIAESRWRALSEQQRGWVTRAATEAAVFNDRELRRLEAEELTYARGHMTFTHPDTSSWRAAVADVYRQFLHVEGFESLYRAIAEVGRQFVR